MVRVKNIILMSLIFSLIFGCTPNKTATTHTSTSAAIPVKTKKLSIAKMLEANNHLSIEARIALYHQLKNEQPHVYNFENENELNEYGYALLNANLEEEAVEIFKLNVAQFPNSGNAYDSLADGYSNLSYKYRELSKLNREKSIQIFSLLDLDKDWGTEIFHFPLRFAEGIDYQGIEDARFPPKGWSDSTSNYFWTYLFAWNINATNELTVAELQDNLKLYFDGLMTSVNKNEAVNPKITIAEFQKMDSDSLTQFTGTVRIFDAFTSQRPIVLNVLVDYHYCKTQNTAQILYRFSPKPFGDEVWTALKKATFREDICGF